MSAMRAAAILLLTTLFLCMLTGCVTLPPRVAEELRPAASDQPNNFRKSKDD